MTTKLDAEMKIRRSTERFMQAVAGLSASQWSSRPATGGWSASEVTEHVTLANRGVLAVLQKRMESPLSAPLAVADDEIPYLFYRGDEPPSVAPPTGTWNDASAAAQQLEASARAVVDWAGAVGLDLRAYGSPHPAFGLMDGVQWLLFASAHTERHRAQLVGLFRETGLPAD